MSSGRLRVVSAAFVAQANQFCFQVTLPIQLFCNIYRQQPQAGGGRLIGFAVVAVLAVAGLLCLLVPGVERDRRACASMIQGIFRGNFLLFGLPLALNMFGEEGVLPTALLLPVAIPLYNVLAVVILTHFGEGSKGIAIKPMLQGIIRNPLILGQRAGPACEPDALFPAGLFGCSAGEYWRDGYSAGADDAGSAV